jgi:hypothetical protein
MAVEYRPPIKRVKRGGNGEAVAYWPFKRGKAVEYRPPKERKMAQRRCSMRGGGTQRGLQITTSWSDRGVVEYRPSRGMGGRIPALSGLFFEWLLIQLGGKIPNDLPRDTNEWA